MEVLRGGLWPLEVNEIGRHIFSIFTGTTERSIWFGLEGNACISYLGWPAGICVLLP